MAGWLEALLAGHLQGRGAAQPIVPPPAMADAPPGIPSAWEQFTAAPAPATAMFPGELTEAEQAEEARQAAARRLGRRRGPAGASRMAPESPVPFSAGMLSPYGVSWPMPPEPGASGSVAPDMPPSTNDPMSSEPVIFQDGVPLPRPRPPGVGDGPDTSPGPNAPFSMAPQGEDGATLPAGATPTGPQPLPQRGPAAPPAADQQPAAGGGLGMDGILGKIFNPANAPMLLALGGGLSGAPSLGTGIRRGASAAAPQAALLRKEQTTEISKAETYRALVARGIPPQEALAAVRSPELMKALVAKHFETKPAQVVNGRLVREKPDGTVELLADYSKEEDQPRLSAGYQWKDPKRKELGQTHIVDGPEDPRVKALSAKLSNPPEWEWVDPNDHSKGQRLILGRGEKVDAQVAARLGLAKSFMDQLPEIRRRVAAGEATGAWDAAMAQLGYGAPGELKRQIASGAEALLRNLTGAGMGLAEASKYVARYELQPHNTAAVMLSKLDQLSRELIYTDEAVRTGRGGAVRIVNGEIVSTRPGGPTPPTIPGTAPAPAVAPAAAGVVGAAPPPGRYVMGTDGTLVPKR